MKILFFNVPEKLPLVAELHDFYQRKNGYESKILSEPGQVLQEVAAEKNGIIIFKVENKNDLQKAVTVLKSQKRLIKKGLVRPACLTFFKNKKVEHILQKYGCIDLIEPDKIRAKNFSFKIDFWSKNIRAQLKKTGKDLALSQPAENKVTADETVREKGDYANVAALELASDIWITKNKNDHKKVLRKYLSRLLGPSPHVGQWVELKTRPGDKQASWKFVLKDEEAQFIMDDGAWYFSGAKPEFDWKTHRWSFSAETPHLYFYTDAGKFYSKIKFSEGQVQLADNSSYALTKEEMILETCQSKFAFEGEGLKDEESNTAAGEDADGPGELKGKGGPGDELDGHWDGESSTDDLGEDKIKGKLSHESEEGEGEKKKAGGSDEGYEGHYSGKGNTDHIDSGPLSGELDASAPGEEKGAEKGSFSEDDLGGNYDGKGSSDNLGEGKIKGKLSHDNDIAPGEEADPDRKGFSEEESGPYQGKSEADELDRGPLNGKLGPGKEKESEDKDGNFSEDPTEGHYGGKSSSETLGEGKIKGRMSHESDESGESSELRPMGEKDLGGNYDGESSGDNLGEGKIKGKMSHEREDEDKDPARSGVGEDDLGGHYGGKGSSDELDRDPLKGELSPTNAKANKNKQSEFPEDDLGGHYGGKGGTDKIDRDPLNGKLKPGSKKPNGNWADADDEMGPPGKGLGKPVTETEGEVEPPEEGELARDLSSDLRPSAAKPSADEPTLDAVDGELTKDSKKRLQEAGLENSVIEANNIQHKNANRERIVFAEPKVNTESGELEVVLKVVREGEEVDLVCSFEDFFPDELVVIAGKDELKLETPVKAMVKLEYAGQKFSIQAEGRVFEVEEYLETSSTVTIALDPVDEKQYEDFMALFQDRQTSIHEFMRLAKGYE